MKTSQWEYFEELKNLQDGTIKNLTKVPSDEPRFVIDSNTRKITVPNEFKFLAVKNDANAEKIYFEIDRYFDSEDLSNHTIVVQYSDVSTLCDENAIVGIDAVTDIDLTTEPGKILFRWTVKHEVTFKATDIAFAIRFYTVGDDNKFTYSFNTVSVCLPVLDTLDTTNDAIQRYANILDEWLEKMGNIESSIDSKISGMKTDIEILKYEAHTHQNKAVIDKLSENDSGKLLFDGNVICDGASREYVDTELEKKVNNSDFDIAKNDIQENKSSISKLKEDKLDKPANPVIGRFLRVKSISDTGEITLETVDPQTATVRTSMDDVTLAGAKYFLGEQTALSITMPTDAQTGQEIMVVFSSGQTACTLAVDLDDFNFVPKANSMCKIVFLCVAADTWLVDAKEG